MSVAKQAVLILACAALAAGCQKHEAKGGGGQPAAAAPDKATNPTGKPLAINRVKSTGAPMQVSSTAFAQGGEIPEVYTGAGTGATPPLLWNAVEGAKGYVVVVEDPDAPGRQPFVHWIVGVPGTVTTIDDGSAGGKLPAGAVGWSPPKPPAGARHNYHFQVFALNAAPNLPAGADLAAVESAVSGKVIGAGETVGVFAMPTAGAAPAS
jgi:Raf kinase inhibitor-like YbhB/YbcL family protein